MNDYQILPINMGEAWRSKGLCVTEKISIDFFTDDKYETSLAKSICKRCIVADQCLQFAVKNEEKHGIWGGFTSRERNKLTRSMINLTKEEAKNLVIKYGNEVLS